jgi:Uma2 family endonuclease
MSTASKFSFVEFDEFCLLVDDGQKADLIDGVIYLASPDNTGANELNVWLCALISIFVRQRDLGKVFASRVAFRLDDRNGPEPDKGRAPQSGLARLLPPAAMVLERRVSKRVGSVARDVQSIGRS